MYFSIVEISILESYDLAGTTGVVIGGIRARVRGRIGGTDTSIPLFPFSLPSLLSPPQLSKFTALSFTFTSSLSYIFLIIPLNNLIQTLSYIISNSIYNIYSYNCFITRSYNRSYIINKNSLPTSNQTNNITNN